jgi:hypothetical protein
MNKKDQESEWYWVDFMEDDIDESLKEDLSLILEHSKAKKDILTDFRAIREIVAASDLQVDENPGRFSRIQNNVMSRIQQLDMEPSFAVGPFRSLIPSQAYLLAGLMTLVVAFSIVFTEHTKNRMDGTQETSAQEMARAQEWLIEDSLLGSEPIANTILEYRDQNDLLQKDVVEALSTMSEEEVNDALNGLSQ